MSEIKIPPAENTVELLKGVDQATAIAQSGLEESSAALKDLVELKARNIVLETEIKEARKTMYLLVFEKLASRQMACLEEYGQLLTRQSDILTPPPKEKA